MHQRFTGAGRVSPAPVLFPGATDLELLAWRRQLEAEIAAAVSRIARERQRLDALRATLEQLDNAAPPRRYPVTHPGEQIPLNLEF